MLKKVFLAISLFFTFRILKLNTLNWRIFRRYFIVLEKSFATIKVHHHFYLWTELVNLPEDEDTYKHNSSRKATNGSQIIQHCKEYPGMNNFINLQSKVYLCNWLKLLLSFIIALVVKTLEIENKLFLRCEV